MYPVQTNYLSETLVAPGIEPRTSVSVASNIDQHCTVAVYPLSPPLSVFLFLFMLIRDLPCLIIDLQFVQHLGKVLYIYVYIYKIYTTYKF